MFDYVEDKQKQKKVNELEIKKENLKHLIQIEKQSLSLLKKAFDFQAKINFQNDYNIDITLSNMTNTILEIERQILLYNYKVNEINKLIDELKS